MRDVAEDDEVDNFAGGVAREFELFGFGAVFADAAEGVVAFGLEEAEGVGGVGGGKSEIGEAASPGKENGLGGPGLVGIVAGVVGEIDARGKVALEFVALALVEDGEDGRDEGGDGFGGIVEDDDGGLVVGAHVDHGLVTGATAAVADVGVVADAFDLEAEAPGGLPVGVHELDALHLAERGGFEYLRLLGAQEAEVPGGEFAEVDDGGSVAGGGCDAARVEGLDEVAGAVTFDGTVGDGELFAVELHGHVGAGVGEAEGVDDVGLRVGGVGFARDGGHGFADESEAEVAVLEVALGGVESGLGGDDGLDLIVGGEGEVGACPVGLVGLAGQAGGVGEEAAEGDGSGVAGGWLERGPGEIGVDGGVKLDFAGFVLLHEGDGGEELGDGADGVDGLRRGGDGVALVDGAVALGPDEVVADDDAGGERGEVVVGLDAVKVCVNYGEGFGALGCGGGVGRGLGVDEGREKRSDADEGQQIVGLGHGLGQAPVGYEVCSRV
jgi:hypothetical protein